MEELTKTLLQIGGKKVNLIDNDENLVKLGHLYNKEVLVVKGNRNNFTKYFDNPDVRIVSGYALKDDVWEPRAWLLVRHRTVKIVDNQKCDQYFGISKNI